MLNKTAYVVYGQSGAGKSTKAQDILIEVNDVGRKIVHIERDLIRKDMYPPFAEGGWEVGFPHSLEKDVTIEQERLIAECAEKGYDIIISDTLCKIGTRRKLRDTLESLGYTIEWIRLKVPLTTCVKRDRLRGKWMVSRKIIATQYENLKKDEDHV